MMLSIRGAEYGMHRGRRALAILVGFLVAVTSIVGAQLALSSSAAHAAPPTLALEAWWQADEGYRGVAVNVKVHDLPESATQVRVTVHRADGGDVVKTSRTTGSIMALLADGNQVTAPIVIQPGTYDEAGSGSWHPADALWTSATVPTGVTVDLLEGEAVLTTASLPISSFGDVGADDVMPKAPELAVDAHWISDDGYRGVAVNVSSSNVPDAATQLRVIVHRAEGGDVVKTSKLSGSVMPLLRPGGGADGYATAPIVIQRGSYNEAGSSSWNAPVAVWGPGMVPTSITAELLAGDAVIASATGGIGSIGGLTAADVMPTSTPPVVVEIPDDVPTYVVDVPAGAEDVRLDLGAPTGTENAVVVPVEVVVSSPIGVSVVLPASTTITSPDAAWDGNLLLPRVVTDVVVPVPSGQTATIGVAIELGSPTGRLVFDTPVKIVLADQAGKSAGYVESGVFHAITTECPATIPAGMTSDECWTVDGDDLVIWTTHFTTFVSYATAIGGGGLPGAGGGPASLAATGGSQLPMIGVAAFGISALGMLLILAARRRQTVPVTDR